MNIIYFSPINWGFLKQRPQHIAEELSKNHTVYFIEPSISIIKSIVYKKNFHRPREYDVNANLKVIRPSGKFRLPKVIDLFDFTGLNLAYEKKFFKQIIEQSDLIWVGSPIYYDLVKNFGKKIIYDKMDVYEKLTSNIFLKKLIQKSEKKLISKSTFIFASSQILYNQIEKMGKPVALVRNGLDESLCINKEDNRGNKVLDEIKKIKENDNVIFGYIGTVDHWFDYNAINQIIDHNKKNKVVIVGHNNMPIYNHENLYYFDAVPKNELSSIIKEFDYCLYTFKRNSFLDSIDPVKIYEYLSLNKKIIAVYSAETKRFEKKIKLYTDDINLEKILNELESMKIPFNNNDELIGYISDNSWNERTSSMIEHMRNHKIWV